ncbi:hypothetical protein [Vibrio barjaei]|uniref:hypothetical protein n=1 Tax=Vibrio barjaei TaxID=1676683 RepID=UPI0022840978|nr:hypothetical protein [Vibrio barjaei]MCY9873006.1 hypothetical protein [Vibrio barjaei]
MSKIKSLLVLVTSPPSVKVMGLLLVLSWVGGCQITETNHHPKKVSYQWFMNNVRVYLGSQWRLADVDKSVRQRYGVYPEIVYAVNLAGLAATYLVDAGYSGDREVMRRHESLYTLSYSCLHYSANIDVSGYRIVDFAERSIYSTPERLEGFSRFVDSVEHPGFFKHESNQPCRDLVVELMKKAGE